MKIRKENFDSSVKNYFAQPRSTIIWLFSQNIIFRELKKKLWLYLLLLINNLKHLNAMQMIATQDLKINKNLLSSLKSSINKTHSSSIPLTLRVIRSSSTSQTSLLLITELIPVILKSLEKPVTTNVQIKSNSNMAPSVSVSVLKDSYLELIKSAQNATQMEKVNF